MPCFVCKDNPETEPFCPRCGNQQIMERENEINDDRYYQLACEQAKEDWFLFGIARTNEEVKQEAERMRKLLSPK